MRTDLGRSVGVTIATQLVWLTWFTGPTSHSPQQPCNQKDTHLKSVNKPPYIDSKPTATPSGEESRVHIFSSSEIIYPWLTYFKNQSETKQTLYMTFRRCFLSSFFENDNQRNQEIPIKSSTSKETLKTPKLN